MKLNEFSRVFSSHRVFVQANALKTKIDVCLYTVLRDTRIQIVDANDQQKKLTANQMDFGYCVISV